MQLRLRSGTARLVWPANDCPVVMVLLVEPGATHEAEHVARALAANPGVLSLIAMCADSIEWIADHASQLGADGRRLILAGVDGAAGVATALAIRARDRGWPVVEHQLLIQPRLGAPLGEPRLVGLPATTVVGGDQDSRAYVATLRRAGVPVWELDDAGLPAHMARVLGLAG